jgi:beta-mannosidase
MRSSNPVAGWRVRATSGPVPAHLAGVEVVATVPGTVHTDLLDAGLIPDPYVDDGERELAWMRRTHWRYTSELVLRAPAADERVDLVLAGVDTVATTRLGEEVVARTANMHRSYRLDVRDPAVAAQGAPLSLTVDFASALEHAEAEQERIGFRPGAYPQPLNMVRKMACSFGWDWGPDLQTAGLWQPVTVERWRVARITSVRPLVSLSDDLSVATVSVHLDVELAGLGSAPGELVVGVRLGGVEVAVRLAAGAASAVVDVVVADPELWWPRGHGEAVLHDLEVTLGDADGTPLDAWHRRIGLRSVALHTTPDEHGTSFTLLVNGRPLFVKGANWIPDDHLLTRITRGRLARRIDQAVGAGLNLLRVWGGGVYESEDFYELCDEAGLMVWQDFLLACAAYPEEEPHFTELEAEAREQVTRLSCHPSLVIWNGGNENLWGFIDWGWQEQLENRTWGWRYYSEVFPRVLAELDPTRPYAQGSPCSPGHALTEVHPNDPDHGTHHEWDVWNRVDHTAYRDAVPRFCSEFGFQGPPTWATLQRAVRDADGGVATKDHPTFLLHQKAEDGNAKLDRGLEPHLGVPDDFTDWHWATQLNQARAVAYALTHYRSWWPRTAGAVVWQLNDCWPVTSWAAVDGDERPKPLWWALRAAFADRLLTVQRRPGPSGVEEEVVAVVNDTDDAWDGVLLVRRERLDGTMLASADVDVAVAPRSVHLAVLGEGVRLPGDAASEVLVAELGDRRTVHTWAEDVDLSLDPAPLGVVVVAEPGGYRVDVTARSLAKDITLLVDRLDPDAVVDAALVTLPAGARATFHVKTTVADLEGALAGPPVLRCANDVVVRRVTGLRSEA